MNLRLILCVAASASIASCASGPTLKVVDSASKAPVPGARVTAVRGDLSSGAVLTDGNGEAGEPTLPGGARALVISGAGYHTKTVSLNP